LERKQRGDSQKKKKRSMLRGLVWKNPVRENLFGEKKGETGGTAILQRICRKRQRGRKGGQEEDPGWDSPYIETGPQCY